MATADTVTRADAERVEAMRRFNRFYTRRIGVLDEGMLKTPFSLAQGRVLYEVAHQRGSQEGPTATEVGQELGLDPGYLSRILRDLEKRGLIARKSSEADGRQSHLSLTAGGREVMAQLDTRARDEVRSMIGALGEPDQRRLMAAMDTIARLLGPGAGSASAADAAAAASKVPYILRPPQPGDMGWIVHRHAVLYTQAYQWDDQFEALVATIVGEFVQRFDPKRERCWIAEKDGEVVGCVFVVKGAEETVAKLRLLLVEPTARGLGIGGRLVDECLRFARRVGYKKMTLWTQSHLLAARGIYARAGFQLVKQEPHHSFGHDLVGETWDIDL
jgi:DNA-binding MarR family transcriptional regulator/N-acetylglutamate synthase-like GNAT family acetyltransferase